MIRRWFFVSFVPLLALGLVGCAERPLHEFFRQPPETRRPFLFAHRGGGGLEPEETLPALVGAQTRDPLAIVELDVHRSRDGHLVVIHDDTVDRTTDGEGAVADKTLAELKALDAGYCATPGQGDGTAKRGTCKGANVPPGATFPFRGKGHRIPTLDEVLAALPAETFISIEVKAAGFERAFADRMRASGRLSRLVTGSEDDDVAVRIKDLLPEAAHYYPRAAATCLALSAKVAIDFASCPAYDVFASPRSAAGLALDTERVIEAAHRRGVAVVYWTINDEPEMERLLRLGADGLFTDYPDAARRVIDRLRAEKALP